MTAQLLKTNIRIKCYRYLTYFLLVQIRQFYQFKMLPPDHWLMKMKVIFFVLLICNFIFKFISMKQVAPDLPYCKPTLQNSLYAN